MDEEIVYQYHRYVGKICRFTTVENSREDRIIDISKIEEPKNACCKMTTKVNLLVTAAGSIVAQDIKK